MPLDDVTRETIKPLLELQRIDSLVDRLTARKADLPEQRELDELLGTRAQVDARRAAEQGSLDEVIRDLTKLEHEVGQLDERADSESKRLYSGEVGSPRELSNIQAELDALARRKTHLEDQELDVMERREELETTVKALEAEIGTLDASIADATARRDAATAEIDGELEELAGARAGVLPSVDPELVELYEDLRGKYKGVAVGALEDRTCRACSLPLSPVAWDEYKRTDDAIVRCENCRRLLIEP